MSTYSDNNFVNYNLDPSEIEEFLLRARELAETTRIIRETCNRIVEDIKDQNGGIIPPLMFMGVNLPVTHYN